MEENNIKKSGKTSKHKFSEEFEAQVIVRDKFLK